MSGPSVQPWHEQARALYAEGHAQAAIARMLGVSQTGVSYALRRRVDSMRPGPTLAQCAAIRPSEPETWIGAPRGPVAALPAQRRPVVIPEADITHPVPGLWVSR